MVLKSDGQTNRLAEARELLHTQFSYYFIGMVVSLLLNNSLGFNKQ